MKNVIYDTKSFELVSNDGYDFFIVDEYYCYEINVKKIFELVEDEINTVFNRFENISDVTLWKFATRKIIRKEYAEIKGIDRKMLIKLLLKDFGII